MTNTKRANGKLIRRIAKLDRARRLAGKAEGRTGLVSREHNVYGTTPVEYVTYTDEAAAVVYHLTDATGQPVAAGEHTDPEGYRFRIAAAADITDRREDDGTPTHVGITWIHADNESSGWTRPGHLGAGWAWTPEHR